MAQLYAYPPPVGAGHWACSEMDYAVLYDADVLYPSTLRDLLIRLAQEGLVQAKWTDRILDEVVKGLSANRPDLDPTRLARTRDS